MAVTWLLATDSVGGETNASAQTPGDRGPGGRGPGRQRTREIEDREAEDPEAEDPEVEDPGGRGPGRQRTLAVGRKLSCWHFDSCFSKLQLSSIYVGVRVMPVVGRDQHKLYKARISRDFKKS